MKHLIFTIALLPFFAAYPAAKSANAKVTNPESEPTDLDSRQGVNAAACAADVKIADADLKSARDEKAQSADQKSEIYFLEQQLFPGIHFLFSQARGIERELMTRVACLLDPKPIKDKYQDVVAVFECPCPLWEIISGYAVEIPPITQEIFSTLVPEAEYSRIGSLAAKIRAVASAPAFIELLRAFHDDNPTYDQCWPYSRAMLDSFLHRGYIYRPINLDLTMLEHSGRSEHLNSVPPWGRPFRNPNERQHDADQLVEVLKRIEQYHTTWQEKESKKAQALRIRLNARRLKNAMRLQFDDTVYESCPEEPQSVRRGHASWQNTCQLISHSYSWDKILKWLITLPAEQQKAFADRIRSVKVLYEAEQAFFEKSSSAPCPPAR